MTASIADGLSGIVPQRALLPSERHPDYAVDGLSPMAVVVPEDRRQVAEVMRWAAENGVTVFPLGGSTKLALGNPPESVGLALDLSHLNRVIDYQPGDLTVTVEAGITLDALQQELAAARQFVPLESPLRSRATVGGSVSTASVGVMAHAYGPPRDWLIGIGVVGADGTETKAGGRVVKNVTGYDLNKLYTGSLGTLGVIVEASFKVSPLQPEECLVAAPFGSMADAVSAGRELLATPAGPMSYVSVTKGLARHLLSSPEVTGGNGVPLSQELREKMGGLGLCFFSGRAKTVRRRVEETSAALFNAGADDAARIDGEGAAATPHWAADLGWREESTPTLALKLSAPRRAIPSLAADCLGVRLTDMSPEMLADPGFGTVRLFYWGEAGDEEVLETVCECRRVAQRHNGTAVVEICRPYIKTQMDVWGEEPGSMEIMRRLKEQFDPQRLLNRGRFLGRL